MDIAGTYQHFQHEQFDADNPANRTRFDEFGAPKEAPTVEGFCSYGRNPHQKQTHALSLVEADIVMQAEMSKQRNAEARRRCNRLIALRSGK